MTVQVPTGASMRRGRSKQDYATPRDFLDAVERRFGKIALDLAAASENCVVASGVTNGRCFGFCHYGPGSKIAENALKIDWREGGLLWLNPPFADIGPWAEKCADWTRDRGRLEINARIILLVPASVGSEWWHEFIRPCADALFLSPRLTFVGTDDPYPKDLALCVFDPMRFDLPKVSGRWRWKP